ncbi:hypothetical protein JOC70_000722 [Clostridium pascui]|uniref:hypothetical protein n=1 Tax=Clostridium pascui TaxID=46609 RepID=UPI00195E5B3F|nr:hypothetical protein [Clostridium pascui]MBM7869253.1 hypothetical protein [Clostridium pascui]
MDEKLIKNNVQGLYDSVPDVELYNNIYKDLKIVFIEYMKAKFPAIAAFSVLRHNRLIKIEEDRLNRLLEDVQDKIKKVDINKIDYDFIKKEEFARIVFDVLDKAKSDYREEKLKYYANILINYSTIEFSGDFYKEYIIDRIANYTIEHILLLEKVYEKHLELNDNNKLDYLDEDLPLENLSKEVTDICINTLVADGFLIKGFWGDGYLINERGIKCVKLIEGFMGM